MTQRTLRRRCVFTILALAWSSAMALEEPRFERIESDGSFDLRRYPACIVAETEVASDFANAGNAAFGRLARTRRSP